MNSAVASAEDTMATQITRNANRLAACAWGDERDVRESRSYARRCAVSYRDASFGVLILKLSYQTEPKKSDKRRFFIDARLRITLRITASVFSPVLKGRFTRPQLCWRGAIRQATHCLFIDRTVTMDGQRCASHFEIPLTVLT